MGDATPYSDAELAELRALHEGLCDDTDCTSQRLYATIDSLRAILATAEAERDGAVEAVHELECRLENVPCVVDEHETLAATLATETAKAARLRSALERIAECDCDHAELAAVALDDA